jgi:hypothetical protein
MGKMEFLERPVQLDLQDLLEEVAAQVHLVHR